VAKNEPKINVSVSQKLNAEKNYLRSINKKLENGEREENIQKKKNRLFPKP
jgi:hypothetical protein